MNTDKQIEDKIDLISIIKYCGNLKSYLLKFAV